MARETHGASSSDDDDVARKATDHRHCSFDAGSERNANINTAGETGEAKKRKKKKSKSKSKKKSKPTTEPGASNEFLTNTGFSIMMDENMVLRVGGQDEGIFARSSIASGTRLFNEPPMMALSADEDNLWGIYEAYQLLSPQDQNIIWSLKPRPTLVHAETTVMIEALVDYYLSVLLTSEETRTAKEQATFEELGPILAEMCHAWRIAARFLGYRYSLSTAIAADRLSVPRDISVTGFFATAVYLQHSCVPNCFFVYNTETGRMTVHATRHIHAGEQLTVSHIGNNIWYQPAAYREQMLLDVTGQTCLCRGCDHRFDDHSKNETMRNRLHVAVALMAQFLTSADAEKHSAPYAKIREGADIYKQTLKNEEVVEALSKARHIIELLTLLGCNDIEVARWANALKDIILPWLRENEDAVYYAKIAVDIGLRCWGADHPDHKALEAGLEAAEKRLAEAKKVKAETRAARLKAIMKHSLGEK